MIGLACRALGDEDGADLELDAARSIFARLGAGPDLARIDTLTNSIASINTHRLTARDLQVLRLVAAGRTNASVAAELALSERTIERHLSNIFTKLDLSTRTAAAAWAYEHGLI
jgi:DNA-binding NarL/FixJ family response regulator